MLSMEMLQEAQRILDPVINHTPVVATRDIVPDCDFYLKADCLQKTEIGRASVGKECVRRCRSRWSPYH